MDKFNFLQGKIGDLSNNQNKLLPIDVSNQTTDNEQRQSRSYRAI